MPTAVRKAVIPAAGMGTRQYPATSGVRKEFFPLVDRDGYAKPLVQMGVEEALSAGIEEVCIVCQPDAAEEFRSYFAAMPEDARPHYEGKDRAYEWSERLEEMGRRLAFVPQEEQHGLGHAVWCARQWVGDEPFLMILGDHVFISRTKRSCAGQVLDAFAGHSITALTRSPEEAIRRFGVARGRPAEGAAGLIEVDGFLEKPTPEAAREQCRIRGVPSGQYLTHFGLHLFTPGIFDVLDRMIAEDRRTDGEFQLTGAQDRLARIEPYCGLVVAGERFDVGTPAGLLEAQTALALAGEMRSRAEQWWSDYFDKFGRT